MQASGDCAVAAAKQLSTSRFFFPALMRAAGTSGRRRRQAWRHARDQAAATRAALGRP